MTTLNIKCEIINLLFLFTTPKKFIHESQVYSKYYDFQTLLSY